MNQHERDRIAAAMNQARPDWPAKQLKTLLNDPRLAERPRRDVLVALAWVACENASASPYRVLEAGPWWQAAGVETEARPPRDGLHTHELCSVCLKPEPDCRRLYASDHDFERNSRVEGKDVSEVVAAMKELIVPTVKRPEPKPLPAVEDRPEHMRAAYDAVPSVRDEDEGVAA